MKRGEVNIRCVWCGSADPSFHMGLNLETGWYSCWRNRAAHSGKSPLRLIMRLLNLPYGLARKIAGLGEGYVDPEGFDALAARLVHSEGIEGRPEQLRRRTLVMDASFRDITSSARTARHRRYLEDRGFDGESGLGLDVDVLCEDYALRAGVSHEWADRIVLPYFQDGELMTWTGRAIGRSSMRYRDLEIADSVCKPKETLFNHDAMFSGGRVLALAEGPFDALKLDFYGKPWGVRAVALSTNSITEDQMFLLAAADELFERVLVMMDNADITGVVDSMRMRQSLAFIRNVETVPVPARRKDAGELTAREVIDWARNLTETMA